jgi:glycogen(starch) synthase
VASDTAGKESGTLIRGELFRSGEYVRHFYPDDKRNPFFRIYAKKKRDTVAILNSSKYPKAILDIGGGMGRLSLALARLAQNEVVLTDISVDMLRSAGEQTETPDNLRMVNGDAHLLPFTDHSFDYVIALDLLCHLHRPQKALREFHRVLRVNGRLILDSTNSNPLWALFYPRYLGKNPRTWLKIVRFRGVYPGWEKIVRHYSKKTFFSLLHENGFGVLRSINYGPILCPKWHLAITKKVG